MSPVQSRLLACAAAVLAAPAIVAGEPPCTSQSCHDSLEDEHVALLQQGSRTPGTSSSSSSVSTEAQEVPYQIMSCPDKRGAKLQTTCLSHFGYKRITKAIRDILDGLDSTCNESECPQADWSGCVLRLAGHDLMDYDGHGKGGSDGCLDFSNPDNAGLRACLLDGDHGVSLRGAYEQFCGEVSLADFMVIAGEAVISWTRDRAIERRPGAPGIDFENNFRFGRKTAKTCFDNVALPNPANGCAAVETTFVDQIGLDWAGAAALMGVHTLGRARLENSGFDGWWASPQESRSFDNSYYLNMAASGWQAFQTSSGKWQWRRVDIEDPAKTAHQMMLNTDLCLLYTNGKTFQEIGEPVLAPRDTCCAWVTSRRLQQGLQTHGHSFCGGSGSIAGGKHMILDGGDEEHDQCCHGPNGSTDVEPPELLQEGAKNEKDPEDCGNFYDPESVASEAVLKYANDEAAWLTKFQEVWNHATENGFERTLRPLKRFCGCDLKYMKGDRSSLTDSETSAAVVEDNVD